MADKTEKAEKAEKGDKNKGNVVERNEDKKKHEDKNTEKWLNEFGVDYHLWVVNHDPDLDVKNKREKKDIVGTIVHTTGSGEGLQRIWSKYKGDKQLQSLNYFQRMSNVLIYKGSFIIGYTGQVCQTAPLQFKTNHTTSNSRDYVNDWYKRGKFAKADFSWWFERFPKLEKPTELEFWKNGSINVASVGIDIIEPEDGIYSQEQMNACAKLIKDIHSFFGLKVTKWNCLTHSMVSPIGRCNNNGSAWDLSSRWNHDKIIELANS